MKEAVKSHRRFLLQTGLWFLLFSLPSLALRCWNPDPLGTFAEPKYRWMHETRHAAPEAKIGLVGSSQIETAVDPVRISRALGVPADTLINFGTSWAGRGRDYFLAREMIRSIPTLELLVVEVGRSESDELHRHFHRLASLGDSFNDPLNDLSARSGVLGRRGRVEFWVVETLGNAVAGYAQVVNRGAVRLQFGNGENNGFAATGGWLAIKSALDRPPEPLRARGYVPDPHRRSVRYLERITELCRKEEVGLVFLVVPRFQDGHLQKDYESFLEGLGGILLSFPEPEKLYQMRYWSDRGHMNVKGAALFSDWLAQELATQLIDSSLFD